jgi:hypothetical protein
MAKCSEIKSKLLKIVSDLEEYDNNREMRISAYDNMGGYICIDLLDEIEIKEGMDGILYMTIG